MAYGIKGLGSPGSEAPGRPESKSGAGKRGLALPAVAAGAAMLALAEPALAQTERQTVFDMFFLPGDGLGVAITWLLILMSFLVLGLIIRHLLLNKRSVMLPGPSIEAYHQLLRQKKFREAIERAAEDPTPFGQVVHATLSEAANGYGAMERAIEEEADLIGSRRVRSVELLNVMGAVGPMIGLFGTVYGMIVAFQTIVQESGAADPTQLAGGISTALITTFWGLIVGIPAVAAASLIRNKIDGSMVEVMIQAEMLISPFSPAAKRAAAAAGGAAARGAVMGSPAPTAAPASQPPATAGGEGPAPAASPSPGPAT